jgi:hypothetical protein
MLKHHIVYAHLGAPRLTPSSGLQNCAYFLQPANAYTILKKNRPALGDKAI